MSDEKKPVSRDVADVMRDVQARLNALDKALSDKPEQRGELHAVWQDMALMADAIEHLLDTTRKMYETAGEMKFQRDLLAEEKRMWSKEPVKMALHEIAAGIAFEHDLNKYDVVRALNNLMGGDMIHLPYEQADVANALAELIAGMNQAIADFEQQWEEGAS